MPAYIGRVGDIVLGVAETDDGWSPANRLRGCGSGSGSSFKMLIMLDRLAGTCRGGTSGSAGVELGRESSFCGDNMGAGG